MEPRYDINEVEARIYATWEESGFFNPDVCVARGVTAADAVPFSIVLPPPNVTGELHMGHAAMLVIEDIMVRFNRMLGKRTLWIPGTDHAAIATQSKVEKLLAKEEEKKEAGTRTTRHTLGREAFLKRVNDYATQSHDTITKQVKRMGSSLDWSREAYTLDDKREVAVRTAFKKMYDLGLIYRGDRVVNWDPDLQTTVSDDEVEFVEQQTSFYYLKYGPFTIGTARPETKFGDKYVVMHPDDERYANYKHGEKIELEWINGPITATIIKDKAIDMAFGTGVMTITPAHDLVDFEIAQRHDLDSEPIIDLRGKLLPIAGQFAGMHIKKARPLIIEELKKKGLVEKIDEHYTNRIATDSRGGGIIEPQMLKQWFVAVNTKFKLEYSNIAGVASGSEATLKELMHAAVAHGQIKIMPENFEKIYFHWIENLRDWCISRQIWFGHRIPVWYKIGGLDEIHIGVQTPAEAGRGGEWEQDPDTLDTWFSSGLWPFSTLGWPFTAEAVTSDMTAAAQDFTTYFPNSVLETGYDILFFWVARMILMSGCLLGEVPFREVYLHGLVRDAKGKKMSKSLGNGIDPLEMADKYGADATRLSLIIGASAGNDTKLSEDRIRGYRNFSTKLWNIARFIQMNKPATDTFDADISNRAEIKELEILKLEVTGHLETFEFHLAGEKIYHYIWHTLADKIIESEKVKLRDGNDEEKMKSYALLEHLLLGSLKMLHPFMPFITEEVYQIFRPGKMLMVETW